MRVYEAIDPFGVFVIVLNFVIRCRLQHRTAATPAPPPCRFLPARCAQLPLLPYYTPTGQFPLVDSKRLCIYTLDTAVSQLPVGGDHMIAAIDLKGLGFSNIDVPFMVWLIEAFFEQYPGR
eukprot:GHUV01041540.1.p1 GENE.GHUV01041540.1~~GHUV01041540.1.p1  ORF type:complete len:121 (-),score=26.66 GHUV01041540.1:103-465(-)